MTIYIFKFGIYVIMIFSSANMTFYGLNWVYMELTLE